MTLTIKTKKIICLIFATLFSFHVWAKDEIKVGCLFPMTGPGALYGQDSYTAVNMAVEELNKSLGAEGTKLTVLVGDTKSKPLRAVQLARDFIDNEKVDFLCGAVSSSVALAVSKVAYSKRTVFIGTDHASPRLVDEALHPYYFRMNNGTRQSMRAGAKYIAEHFNSRTPLKIAFIGPDYDYGYRAWDDMQLFLNKEGVNFTVSSELWPKLNTKEYGIYIDALLKKKPDIVINGHWGKDLVNFILQARETDLFEAVTVMNFDAGGNYETLAALGDKMPLGVVLSARHHVNWPSTNENRLFVSEFYQRAGRYPSYAAEGAYSGIKAIHYVINKVSDLSNHEKLLATLKKLKIKLPEDPEGFESYMDPESQQILQIQSIGKTIKNTAYPPAKVMLGDWVDYYPPAQWAID
jgi:branched-chain amino acid transport system substrate-binding protein